MDLALLWKIFWLFTKVAMFSWGGGPASMGLMQRETVAAGWVTVEEFADALAVGNALPGPIAIKAPVYVGYKIAGVPGAIAGVAGSAVPAALVMGLVVVYFFGVKDSPAVKAMLEAVRPLVVGLLLWTTYTMAYSAFQVQKLGWINGLIKEWDKLIIAGVSFAILTFTNVSPVYLVLAAAALGFLLYR